MKILSVLAIFVFVAACISCGSTKVEPAPVPPPVVVEPVVEEPVVEEPAPVEKTAEEKEYERSVGDTDVSIDTFNTDKNAILEIIKELDVVMKNYDYKSWLNYLDEESISYWSKRPNLSAAQKKLPVKGLTLRTLEDYFKHVFVPARRGKKVTEIRYNSDKNIKAVQIQDGVDIVYYNFNKKGDVWKVHIPENE